jgi:hypothetical protein
VLDISREDSFEISYRKNKERGTVDPMLEALYFKHLYIDRKLPAFKIAEMFTLTEKYVRQVISRVGIGTEAVRKIIRQAAIGKPLKGRHLDAIASVPQQKQPVIVETIIKENLSAKEAQIVAEAIAKKPEAERLLELPKPKLVEEAKKITTPPHPPPPSPEEEILKRFSEEKRHYPKIMVDYVLTRYRGKHFKDVLRAVVWLLWSQLDEAKREETVRKAISMGGEKGFEEPIVG